MNEPAPAPLPQAPTEPGLAPAALPTRRTILRSLAAAGVALPLANLGELPAMAGTGPRQRVVVIGGGLAGLASAYNLMKRGFEVTVLEAQNRPGGRVLTQREGLRYGAFAELGAVRIYEVHEYTQRYLKEFGLKTRPYDKGTRAYFMQGRRFLAPPAGTPWPITLDADEQPDPGAKTPDYLLSGFDQLGDIFDPGWPAAFPSTKPLDAVTFAGWARSRGASKTWIDWFHAENGNIGRINALAGFAMESVANGQQTTSIVGGNDRLPYAIAGALGRRMMYRTEVTRIAQDAAGVTVTFLDRHRRRRELRADRVVVAMPFPPLRKVQLAGGFSAAKLKAIAELEYMPAARCYFQTKDRFWERDPLGKLGGLMLASTDTFAGRVWNTSSQQSDPKRGLLHSYMLDSNATEYAAYGQCRKHAVRTLVNQAVPGVEPKNIVATIDHVWQDDRWAGGVTGVVKPGDFTWMYPAIRKAEGRVHFAGEHTSIWIAWMNGALESADRVVGEIVAAQRKEPRR